MGKLGGGALFPKKKKLPTKSPKGNVDGGM